MSANAETVTQGAQGGHQVTLRFADEVEHQVQVAHGQSVLAAALAQGVPLISQCESGSCGTCIARVCDGDVRMNSKKQTALLSSEREEGYRLTCQAFAEADSVLELDYPSTLGEQTAEQSEAEITELEWLSSNVVRLALTLPDDQPFEFWPGQYARLRIPGTEEWRSYSMSSAPGEAPRVEFLIRILESGAMSDYLRGQATVGDHMEVEGPHGAFYLREPEGPLVMVAGGTGLAPMMSMLDTVRVQGSRAPKTMLSFGCATPDNLFHGDELELRCFWMNKLEVRTSVDHAPEDYTGRVGTPVDALQAEDVATPGTTAYLCGPPPMIEAARERLIELGLPADRIFAEQFTPSAE